MDVNGYHQLFGYHSLIYDFMFNRRKKLQQVLNNVRKWWQKCSFLGELLL